MYFDFSERGDKFIPLLKLNMLNPYVIPNEEYKSKKDTEKNLLKHLKESKILEKNISFKEKDICEIISKNESCELKLCIDEESEPIDVQAMLSLCELQLKSVEEVVSEAEQKFGLPSFQ